MKHAPRISKLKDKSIIVTGSSTGIGKAIAKSCVAEGAKVVIHGLEADWADETVAELGGENTIALVEDLTTPRCPERLVELAVQTFGRLDAIVNNAAAVPASNIHKTDLPLFRQVLEINTLAPFALIKAALPELSKRRGSVLNIGSVNAWCGEPNLLAYSVSKGALMTLTRNLGDTLFREEGVRVNQINPGWVLTENESVRKQKQGLKDAWHTDLSIVDAPAGRLLKPEEIGIAAVYWLADESGPVSGQVLDLEQYPFIGRNLPSENKGISQ